MWYWLPFVLICVVPSLLLLFACLTVFRREDDL
jgi:hypothetical protein